VFIFRSCTPGFAATWRCFSLFRQTFRQRGNPEVKGTLVRRRVLAGIAVAALALAGCGGGDDDAGTGTGGSEFADLSGSIKATGATFPAPFYTEVITAFKDEAPNLTITYNGTGSGTGKKDFGANLNDFAGTDSLVKDTDGPPPGSSSTCRRWPPRSPSRTT
jgi:phosphate transport system substrate-binding protein